MTPEQRENLSSTQKLSVTLGSGIVAGFAAAVLSHVSASTRNILTVAGRHALVTDQQGTRSQGIHGISTRHPGQRGGLQGSFRWSRTKNE